LIGKTATFSTSPMSVALISDPTAVDAFERMFEGIQARARNIDALDTPEQGALPPPSWTRGARPRRGP
jgi:hypothetical protein